MFIIPLTNASLLGSLSSSTNLGFCNLLFRSAVSTGYAAGRCSSPSGANSDASVGGVDPPPFVKSTYLDDSYGSLDVVSTYHAP